MHSSTPTRSPPGTLGRNTLEAPGIVWAKASLFNEWVLYERLRFQLRFDVNNPDKYHNFNPPNSTFNATDPSLFGTFSGTRGSFSDIGSGHTTGICQGGLGGRDSRLGLLTEETTPGLRIRLRVLQETAPDAEGSAQGFKKAVAQGRNSTWRIALPLTFGSN